MADLSTTKFLIIAGSVIVVVALAVFGLRRGLRKASVEGYGVRADLEGAEPENQLTDQEMQTRDFKSKSSLFTMPKGVRTTFTRSRFDDSVVQIVPDGTPAGQSPGAQQPGNQQPASPDPATEPGSAPSSHPTATPDGGPGTNAQ